MSINPPVPEQPAPNEPEVSSDDTLHFDYPGSDIVLHSCDSHDFHVPKLYIVNSSPVLRDIIGSVSIPSDVPNGEEREPLPVVKLPESGVIIYSLLTFIFPVIPVLPSTSEKVMELLAVAQKYQMDSILAQIRGAVSRQNPPFIRPERAFNIYFLAQFHGLHEEAVQAARVTLRFPMTIEDLGEKLKSPGMTGAYLHELWKYYEQVQSNLRSGVPAFKKSGLPVAVKGLRCIHPYYSYRNTPLHWLDKYIESIAEAPHLFDLIEFENTRARHNKEFQASNSHMCSCSDISSQLIRAFWEALTAFVNGAIEKADAALALVTEEPTSESPDPPFVSICLDIPDANIILRSSDQVNFRVRKSLLALSSPFFEDLLSLPQPPGDELVDGLPVIQLTEDAGLLNSLVSLLYPIPRVIPGSYEKVFALLNACQKYDMISIQSNIRNEVKAEMFPAPVKDQAFSAYAIASSMGLSSEMESSARLTLGQPMTFKSLGEGLRSFKGQSLCELVRYRAANNSSSNSS